MEPEAPGQRLHPTSLLFDAGRHALSLVLWSATVLVFAARSDERWYLLFLGIPLFEALVRYASFRFTLGADHLVIREGLVVRSVRHVPYARIQNVDTVQGPLHRLLGVVEVRLETAGGDEPEAVFRVVSSAQLAELRGRVLARADARAGAEEARPGPFFRMRPVDVALFGLFSQKGLLVLGGALVAVREFEPWTALEERFGADPAAWLSSLEQLGFSGWLLLSLALLVVLQLLTVLWAFVSLSGFRIERRGDDLRTSSGLLTRRTASLPRSRVQVLEVRQGLLQRALRRTSLRALSAGGDSTHEAHVVRKWLVPLVPEAAVAHILAEVQPEADFARVRWQPVHPRCVRRLWLRRGVLVAALALALAGYSAAAALALLALGLALAALHARLEFRGLGWGIDERALFVRSGVLERRAACVRFEKIQSVAVRQTPFDRRLRMARLELDTAGTGPRALHIVIPFLPVREAVRLARSVGRRASAVAFRW